MLAGQLAARKSPRKQHQKTEKKNPSQGAPKKGVGKEHDEWDALEGPEKKNDEWDALEGLEKKNEKQGLLGWLTSKPKATAFTPRERGIQALSRKVRDLAASKEATEEVKKSLRNAKEFLENAMEVLPLFERIKTANTKKFTTSEQEIWRTVLENAAETGEDTPSGATLKLMSAAKQELEDAQLNAGDPLKGQISAVNKSLTQLWRSEFLVLANQVLDTVDESKLKVSSILEAPLRDFTQTVQDIELNSSSEKRVMSIIKRMEDIARLPQKSANMLNSIRALLPDLKDPIEKAPDPFAKAITALSNTLNIAWKTEFSKFASQVMESAEKNPHSAHLGDPLNNFMALVWKNELDQASQDAITQALEQLELSADPKTTPEDAIRAANTALF